MSPSQRRRWRARRLYTALAERGSPPPSVEGVQEFLDLLDPDGDEDEFVDEIVAWIDELTIEQSSSARGSALRREHCREPVLHTHRLRFLVGCE